MKKTNKGFSLVELIIVIAIMAILAGALAPALIKYINKSRLSSDIQGAEAIATAVQSALANENAYDEASNLGDSAWTDISAIYTTGTSFGPEVKSVVGTTPPAPKAKKCMANTNSYGGNYQVQINMTDNIVKVRESGANHLLSPSADDCLQDANATCLPSGT